MKIQDVARVKPPHVQIRFVFFDDWPQQAQVSDRDRMQRIAFNAGPRERHALSGDSMNSAKE